MAGVYRAVNAELQRKEMNSGAGSRPVRNNRVVLLVDIKIETEEFPVEPMHENKSLIAELDDILNKKSRKNLIEY
ncbi:hypothetical protein CAter282_4337 [Collimonas arenae]|uniref:Uncharacterized protein n=2 Tax=Collimonas arenae TaxID=279058 RepID=A0A127QPT6_9BURK|nr:hypothetical protein CAter10_4711 [Collimonas arenae]AMP11997.1 hypothetical protein CAter282_4337 [Collimonas arenae]